MKVILLPNGLNEHSGKGLAQDSVSENMIAAAMGRNESSDAKPAVPRGRRVLICQDGRPLNRRNYSAPAANMPEAVYFRRMINMYFQEFVCVPLEPQNPPSGAL